MKQELKHGVKTDPGCKRELNEDSVGAYPELNLWFVADGMGGHGGGDVASQVVASCLPNAIRQNKPMTEAIREAHASVEEAAREGRGADHMGSTVVALSTGESGYDIAWVGDSRAYLWDGELHQVTRDHSLVQEYLDSHNLDADAVDLSQWNNVITQCLGPANSGTPRVDTVHGDWHQNDRILLCSDGLYNEVPAADIARIMVESGRVDEQQLVDRLVAEACEGGGSDNISVIIVSAPETAGRLEGGAGGIKKPGTAAIAAVTVICLMLLLYLLTNG